MSDYCETAILKGFKEIAFTDHLTIYPDGSAELHSLNELKLKNYVREVRNVSEKYRDKLTVRLGVEVDYIPGNEEILERVLGDYEFDLVIGSVHLVDGVCIDSSRQRALVEEEVRENGFNSFYSRYLYLVGKAVETGFFNIVGHMDLVRIWGFNPTNGSIEEQKVLNLAKNKKMCLEVSSRGLRQPINSIYPSQRIMKKARELEIPLTVGTDAHSVEEIDYAYDFLMSYIRESGYDSVATLSKRSVLEIKL